MSKNKDCISQNLTQKFSNLPNNLCFLMPQNHRFHEFTIILKTNFRQKY